MRFLAIVLLIQLAHTAPAQGLFGTWIGTYRKEQENNRRQFYYRISLVQNEDSVYGICEAFDAKADVNGLTIEDMEPVAAYRIESASFITPTDTTVFEINLGELVWIEGPLNLVNLPPSFFSVKCFQLGASVVTFRPAIINSLLPANNGAVGDMQLKKISDEVPFLSRYFGYSDSYTRREGKRLNGFMSILRPKRKPQHHLIEELVSIRPSLQDRIQEEQMSLVVSHPEIAIALYDNGMVDNDTVSLYFNDQLVLNAQRLTSKAIHLELKLEPQKENTLSLFAHNLGDIAPNTAYLLITCGSKQYPVHLSGSLEKNAVVVFRLLKE